MRCVWDGALQADGGGAVSYSGLAGALGAYDLDAELAAVAEFAGGVGGKGEGAGAVDPLAVKLHVAAVLVLEAVAVVVVPGEVAVGAGIDADGGGLGVRLGGVLLYRADRKDGSGFDEEGHREEVCLRGGVLAAFNPGGVPEVPPGAFGQGDGAAGGALLVNGGHEDVISPEIGVVDEGEAVFAGVHEAEGAHDGQAGPMRLGGGRVGVGEQLVAEIEEGAADLFDVGAVEVGLGWPVGDPAALDLLGIGGAEAPAPGEVELPGAAVAAEGGAEGAELKPADVELGCVLGGGNEAAGVGAPEGDAGEADVDADDDLGGECLPGGEGIAGPEPAEALKACVAVAVKGERTFVGEGLATAFPVHFIALEAGIDGEAVAFVGPPAVDAGCGDGEVLVPVGDGVAGLFGFGAGVGNVAVEVAGRDDVDDHLEVLIVKLLDGLGRIGEDLLVEGEGAVVGVPARGAEAGAEIDEGVAGELFGAEGFCDGEDLLFAGDGAMRLLEAEGPERRELREAGEICVLVEDAGRGIAEEKKDVAGGGCFGAAEAGFCLREDEGALRLADKDTPGAAGAEDPGDGEAGAKGFEVRGVLAVGHVVGCAAAVKGVNAFAEAEGGAVEVEADVGAVEIEADLLAGAAPFEHGDVERHVADADGVLAPGDGLGVDGAGGREGRGELALDDAELPEAGRVVGGRDADAKGVVGNGDELEVEQAGRCGAGIVRGKQAGRREGTREEQVRGADTKTSQQVAPHTIHRDLFSLSVELQFRR